MILMQVQEPKFIFVTKSCGWWLGISYFERGEFPVQQFTTSPV